MTGRGQEMNFLSRLLDEPSGPAGIVIAGTPGVGKSRLAKELADSATRRGWTVHSLQGTAAAQAIPLGAFVQWADQITAEPLIVVSSVIAAITDSPEGAPVLVFVDDVHLLDDLSAFVLHQLVRRRAARVVATLRTNEPTPKTLTELWKDGHLQRLDLQPLSREESASLLQEALGAPVNAEAASRLWELTQGNVLFLHQLATQELHAGRLTQDPSNGWDWTGPVTVSPSLGDLVEVYIGEAPEKVLEILDLMAVAEPLELDYLSALAERATIEDAEDRGLIQIGEQPRAELVRLAHPLYGEARRARLGRMRTRRLFGRIAETMMSTESDAGPADPVRLSLIWLESDLPGDAAVHHRGAAAAFRRLDTALSERLSDAAMRAGAGLESHILHARTLSLLGRADEAEQLLAKLPSPPELDQVWVDAITLRALNLLLAQGHPELSRTVIDEALAAAPNSVDPELLAFQALQLAMDARPAEVIALLDSIDASQLSPRGRINLNFGTTIALGELGRPEQATQTPEDQLVLAANSPVAAFQSVALALIHTDALTTNGNITEAIAAADRVVQHWTDLPKVPQTIAAAVTGVTALGHGDIPTARERLGKALATEELRQESGGLPFLGVGYWLRIAHAEALARAGESDAAQHALDDMHASRHPSFRFLEPNRMLAAAWVAAARGRSSDAIASASQAADFARDHGQHAREVLCLQTALQLGDTADHTDRLTELATLVEGPRAQIAAKWAAALNASDAQGLLEVSQELETLGDRIGAADAAAHAAEVFHRLNLKGSKLTASARATQLATDCGASTPAIRTTSAPLPLSKREREIAAFVRDGLSNKEIAEALTMSVRTVEGHIYRACAKTGVANRAELADLIKQVP